MGSNPTPSATGLYKSGVLYLYITQTGFKAWRLMYRFAGKERGLDFGPYPEVTLTEARDARDLARKVLRAGRDPRITKKQRGADTVAAFGNTLPHSPAKISQGRNYSCFKSKSISRNGFNRMDALMGSCISVESILKSS